MIFVLDLFILIAIISIIINRRMRIIAQERNQLYQLYRKDEL